MLALFYDALTALSSTSLPLLILVFARLSPLFLITPFPGHRAVPFPVRLTLAASLSIFFSLLLLPTSSPPPPTSTLFVLAFKELTIGLTLAFFVAALIWTAQLVGALLDSLRGLPPYPDAQSPLSRIYLLLAVSIFLTAGGHLLLISAFSRSFLILAPFSLSTPQPSLLSATITLTGELFVLAAAIALPAAFCLFLADLLLLFLEQTAPHFSAALNERSLRAVLGLLLFILTLRLVIDTVVSNTLDITRALDLILKTPQ